MTDDGDISLAVESETALLSIHPVVDRPGYWTMLRESEGRTIVLLESVTLAEISRMNPLME